jgi:lysophospholipase L1-like esterase
VLAASSSESVPSSGPLVPPANNGTQVIEYYGDSTVWGYRSQSGGQVAKPAPAIFAEVLSTAGKYDVRNEGVSGSTACQLLNGTDGKHPAWSSQMASSKANYVLVNFAINDEWKYDLTTYKSCMRSLAQTTKQHGKQMIFETPNPTRDSGSTGLDVYVNAMKEVASQEQVPVIDQYKYLTDYLKGQSPYTICPDGLHPTEAVYAMKGKYAANVFLSLFE